MTGYCDASHGDLCDNGLSTYGCVFILNGAVVDWASRKQDRVAHSTAEAEFVAASQASKEALRLKKLMSDVGLSTGMTIKVDNTCALKLVEDGAIFSVRNKHIGVHFFATMERARLGDVTFSYVPSADNTADISTKTLDRTKLLKFRSNLGVM